MIFFVDFYSPPLHLISQHIAVCFMLCFLINGLSMELTSHIVYHPWLLADHCIFDKWAPLVDGANTECKVSIVSSNPHSIFQLNFAVFAKGLITLAM